MLIGAVGDITGVSSGVVVLLNGVSTDELLSSKELLKNNRHLKIFNTYDVNMNMNIISPSQKMGASFKSEALHRR